MPDNGSRLAPEEVEERVAAGAKIVDVRTAEEYEDRHIPGSILVPIGELARRLEELLEDEEIICVCERGARSLRAAQFLIGLVYTNVAEMEGGMQAWTGPTDP